MKKSKEGGVVARAPDGGMGGEAVKIGSVFPHENIPGFE